MEKWLEKVEREYELLYKEVFTELSKLQIEEKFLERQVQTLVDSLKLEQSDEVQQTLLILLENSDPDLELQSQHITHIENLSNPMVSIKIEEVLTKEFGGNDSALYAFK